LPLEPENQLATLAPAPVIVIQPSKGLVSLRLKELWDYHELLFFLTWRDIKIRYKQTALGAVWAILQPFLTMVVFSVFFGRLAKVPFRWIALSHFFLFAAYYPGNCSPTP